MPRSPAKRTNERRAGAADADSLFVHVAGRTTRRLSKRRVALAATALASAVAAAGFAVGFLLHAVGHG